jgi:hypothetical protein
MELAENGAFHQQPERRNRAKQLEFAGPEGALGGELELLVDGLGTIAGPIVFNVDIQR